MFVILVKYNFNNEINVTKYIPVKDYFFIIFVRKYLKNMNF